MKAVLSPNDRSLHMEERSWWDLWNKSYRSQDTNCAVSNELFDHIAGLVRSLSNGRPRRILEVACGTGTLSRQLSFSGYHGLDISPAAIDIAKGRASELVHDGTSIPTYEAADFHAWPLPPEPVDLLLCVDAISCFRDQQFVIRRMAEALRSGGHCVITTINPVVYNRIRRVDGVRLENGPVSHWLTRSEFHNLVRGAGLTIERTYTIMPRGNMGLLRVLNSYRLNYALGPRGAALFRRIKEAVGLGQYRVVIARKGLGNA